VPVLFCDKKFQAELYHMKKSVSDLNNTFLVYFIALLLVVKILKFSKSSTHVFKMLHLQKISQKLILPSFTILR